MKAILSFIVISVLSTASFANDLVGPAEGKATVSINQSNLLEVNIDGEAAKLLFSSISVDTYKSYGPNGDTPSLIKEVSSMSCSETTQKDNSLKYDCRVYPSLK